MNQIPSFDSHPRTRLVFGADSLDQIGHLTRELQGKRVLLVTDHGVSAAGHPARAAESLKAAGLDVVIFDAVRENPTTLDVALCVEVARHAQIDSIIGLGGGSSIDTAKATNFILTNGGEIKDYWGVGKAKYPMLPLIAVPTTAGTGSECQSFALISDESTHQKMACGDPKAAAKIAILDPLLTFSQPLQVSACTGIDAIAHAVETAVTKPRNPISALYSREAFRLCFSSLESVLLDPYDLTARSSMQIGAAFAGTAIENSMLGAAHAAANPLTATLGMIHGKAVGLMLPRIVDFNSRDPAAHNLYLELAQLAGLEDVNHLISELEILFDVLGLTKDLARFHPHPDLLPKLAADAAKQWTASFNPRPITAPDFEILYASAFGL
ncbi:MAG: iron-containing alcohol dehydrogenase [Verrucomicrobiota bacterium]|jgi:alcohol dehydrogenase